MQGSLKYQLNKDKEEEYAYVISVRFRNNQFQKKNLTNNEALYVLEKQSRKLMNMHITDLTYLALNSYETLLKKNFFKSMDILEGKNICDIAINDYLDVL